jgi:hypothetical protein
MMETERVEITNYPPIRHNAQLLVGIPYPLAFPLFLVGMR